MLSQYALGAIKQYGVVVEYSAQKQPSTNIDSGGVKILYTFATVDGRATGKLKIKINTKAHFNLVPLKLATFATLSHYCKGKNPLAYSLEVLMGTKLRALFPDQRRAMYMSCGGGLGKGFKDQLIKFSAKLHISAIKLCNNDAGGRFYVNQLSTLLNRANITVHLPSKKDWNGEI